jgi:CRP/FNR family transcriptional regulator, cyclic AMP receptor protein
MGRLATVTPKPEESVVRSLAAVPIFASLSPKTLSRIAEAAKERSFAAGDKLVSKGEKGIGLYVVLEGSVEVRDDGKVLAALRSPQFFGEMALLDDQPRTADVVATSPGRCLVVSRWEFWGYLLKEPETIRLLLQETVRRLRSTGKGFSE